MKMNKERKGFDTVGKTLQDYTEERKFEDRDVALGKKVMREASPKAVREFAEHEQKEAFQKSILGEPKDTPFEKDTTILEKRFLLFCNKLKNDPANLYRRLKQSTINLTVIF